MVFLVLLVWPSDKAPLLMNPTSPHNRYCTHVELLLKCSHTEVSATMDLQVGVGDNPPLQQHSGPQVPILCVSRINVDA